MIVALYARVSTGKQAERNLSIPDQLRQMREWCKRKGYGIADEYIEPGATGTDDKRPAFQEMIQKACWKERPYDAIIVHSLSRFFRDMVESVTGGLKMQERGGLKMHGIFRVPPA